MQTLQMHVQANPRDNRLLSHPDLTHRLGMAELQSAPTLAGTRSYFLLHEGVMLNQVGDEAPGRTFTCPACL